MNAQQRAKRRRALLGLFQFQSDHVLQAMTAGETVAPNLKQDVARVIEEYNSLIRKDKEEQ